MKEDYLLDGKLEPTNEPYAVAKIAGIKMCQAYNRQYGTCFISVMPTNLYGPGDNFDLLDSHVIPALMRKFHLAKVAGDPEVVIWGSGAPRREFLYVDDLADACLFLMEHYQESEIINIGVGQDLQILELAEPWQTVIGFKGRLVLDPTYPDGTPRKLLDVSRLTALGWQARTPLEEGLKKTYDWFCQSPWARQVLNRTPLRHCLIRWKTPTPIPRGRVIIILPEARLAGPVPIVPSLEGGGPAGPQRLTVVGVYCSQARITGPPTLTLTPERC